MKTNYSIEFDTSKFERSHGRSPRGRGGWGFCPRQCYDLPNYLDHVKWFNGTYSEAKKQAREHFGAIAGTPVVVVCE